MERLRADIGHELGVVYMLNGIDIASWQENINLSAVPGDFVIIKGTGGTGYVNPYCDGRYQAGKKASKKLGFYHYAHEIGYQGTAIQEADFFIKNCQNYFGEAIPVLDWESDNKTDVAWALAWLNRVYEKTGVRPWFYTYSNVLTLADFSPIANAGYGLWLANYYTDARIDGYKQPNPPAAPGFPFVACYQYSSNTFLSGYGDRLDANVFYGDKTAWDKYAKGEKVTNPTPTPDPTPEVPNEEGAIAMKTINLPDGGTLRTSPAVGNNVLAQLPKGSSVNINDIAINDGFVWGIQPRADGSKGYIDIGRQVAWAKL